MDCLHAGTYHLLPFPDRFFFTLVRWVYISRSFACLSLLGKSSCIRPFFPFLFMLCPRHLSHYVDIDTSFSRSLRGLPFKPARCSARFASSQVSRRSRCHGTSFVRQTYSFS